MSWKPSKVNDLKNEMICLKITWFNEESPLSVISIV